MGRSFSNPPNNGQARLLKIVLPSRKFQKEALKLWNKNGGRNKFPKLSMRESLTQEQLQQRRQLMNECKKKRTKNPGQDWISYASCIIMRSERNVTLPAELEQHLRKKSKDMIGVKHQENNEEGIIGTKTAFSSDKIFKTETDHLPAPLFIIFGRAFW
uniref:Uncharacterized protein n=1 Tax=Meloidogyne hapla TaxID=6305 RepID=A0A1I8B165_MELHA